MLIDLCNLTRQNSLTKNDLLKALQNLSKKIELKDIVKCSLYIHKDAECIHTGYRNEFIKTETEFIIRIREVKDDQPKYKGHVDLAELKFAVELLLEQEKTAQEMEDYEPALVRIYSIISLYTTFIKEEPIHKVGTPFPGGFMVKKEADRYTCPVKDNNQDNPLALCPFCIAEQDEEV
ncbi:MAG: DUF2115 domain-containing protein [Methanobacteriaceae archaeon]